MEFMFYYATSFNQNLNDWCVTNINSEPNNFSSGAPLGLDSKPIWGTCPDYNINVTRNIASNKMSSLSLSCSHLKVSPPPFTLQ